MCLGGMLEGAEMSQEQVIKRWAPEGGPSLQ